MLVHIWWINCPASCTLWKILSHLEIMSFYSTHCARQTCLFALQVTMTQTPRELGTNVADMLANSSNPSDPAEPATAAPTVTSAQTASNENSQGLGTAGPSALSVGPSIATYSYYKNAGQALACILCFFFPSKDTLCFLFIQVFPCFCLLS